MHRLFTGPLTIERRQIAIADLPQHLVGLKLVQFSDFHFDGIRLSQKLLSRAIAASNESAPDLVLLTGDFVTDDPAAIHNLVPWLKQLNSRYGVYAVLGNHDIYRSHWRSEITQALSSVGIHVLWNQTVYPVGPELALVGLADFWSSEFKPAPVLDQLDHHLPRIVLSHNPDSADILGRWRVDLQLSGHTHGGQVVLPGLGSASLYLSKLYGKLPKRLKRLVPWMKKCRQVVKHWDRAQGLHTLGTNQLYVNRGLGTYLPGRLFCPPEVTVITLV